MEMKSIINIFGVTKKSQNNKNITLNIKSVQKVLCVSFSGNNLDKGQITKNVIWIVTKASIKSATISGTSEEEEKEEANTTNGTNNNQINPIIFLFNFTLITLYFIYYNLIVSNIKKKIFY